MVAFSETGQDEPAERLPNDPPEEEIERRSEKIRRKWSQAQTQRRRVGGQDSNRWVPPVIDIRDIDLDETS